MSNEHNKSRRLQELKNSDFEVVDGQPDIRGWDVRDDAGRKIGEVEELIVDAQQKKVRYMVVELDDNEFDLDDDREVLIPIGRAQLHDDDDDVILPGVTAEQLRALPAYDEDGLDDQTERTISMAFGRNTTDNAVDDQFYQHEHFDDNRLYQRRLPASSTGKDQSGFGLRNRGLNSDAGSNIYGDSNIDREGNTYSRQSLQTEAGMQVNDADRLSDNNPLLSEEERKRRNDAGGRTDQQDRGSML